MAKSTGETIWWSLFAVGGVVAALAVPALILITGLLVPLINGEAIRGPQPVTHATAMRLVGSPVGRVFLFVVIALPLFHCVHRFRHTLKDLGVHGAPGLVAALCYGSAIAGTVLAGWLVCTL